MHSLITSYLLQSKECVLPGIGSLHIIDNPATVALEPNRIEPSSTEIIFKRNGKSSSEGLIAYISAVHKISTNDAADLLNNFCKEWKQKINKGEDLRFETIGSIKKDNNGDIVFEREEATMFYQPIEVEELYNIREAQQRQTVVHDADEPYTEQAVASKRSYWWLWALLLFAIAAVMLFYYFKENGFKRNSFGNQNKFVIDTPRATYRSGQ